jgi:hypothetical protein
MMSCQVSILPHLISKTFHWIKLMSLKWWRTLPSPIPCNTHLIAFQRLGLGVFEQQQPGHEDNEMTSSSDDAESSSAESASTSSSEDDSDYDSDSSVEIIVGRPLARPVRPLPRRSQVHIEVLSSTNNPSHQNDNEHAE